MSTPARACAAAPALVVGVAAAAAVVLASVRLAAHSGPPFPVVSNQAAGAYTVSIWTDPDATDDRQPQGKFWIVLERPGGQGDIPAGTEVRVALRATDRPGAPELIGRAAPENGHIGRQFTALLMDHEGPYAVRVLVDGPLGHAEVTSAVDATYDLRPPPALFAVYLLPFVAIGLIWMRVLWKRRALRRSLPAR